MGSISVLSVSDLVRFELGYAELVRAVLLDPSTTTFITGDKPFYIILIKKDGNDDQKYFQIYFSANEEAKEIHTTGIVTDPRSAIQVPVRGVNAYGWFEAMMHRLVLELQLRGLISPTAHQQCCIKAIEWYKERYNIMIAK